MKKEGRNKLCCFSGHRELFPNERERIENRLPGVIERLVKQGVIAFIAGGARGFDTLAALAVLRLKAAYPDIRLQLALPCDNMIRGWTEEEVNRHAFIRAHADDVRTLSQTYYRGCMHRRNRYMVDKSAYCICYYARYQGGTHYTVRYALAKGVRLINLAVPTL